jgi:Metallo-peptidase family M12B Reprolysin-like
MCKLNSLFFTTFVCLFLVVSTVFAGKSEDNIWLGINDSNLQSRSNERLIVPKEYSTFRADKAALNELLQKAPREFSEAARINRVILTLPMPDGTFSRFAIQNSPIMEPALAAKYPEINSYLGQGIDNPNATTRFDMSPVGFRAMILSSEGTVFIEPYAKGDTTNYISFDKKNVERRYTFQCEVGENRQLLDEPKLDIFNTDAPSVINGTTLRVYRLAMAATGEYTTFFRQSGDTDAQAVARALTAINTTMNRVNGVYERDLAVRMVLVANTDLLIYTNAGTDPFTNTSNDLGANQSNTNTVIGAANYDIGHLVGTGGGGVAQLRVPCSANKASGLTGSPAPVADAFDIDYVAHEMGHQFGGNHTFNGSVGNCAGGNRSGGAAYETGSGITIMAYAGICGNQNLAANSIDTFHVRSLEEITAFINNAGTGGSCSTNTPTNNTPPAVPTLNGGGSFNIPIQTPFALSATTTDVNNDAITYDWEEYDLGALSTTVPNTDATGGARPIFRPYLPKTTGIRYFPSLQYILSNANVPPSTYSCAVGACLTGELMPAITRTMTFQVIARDNRAGGGGINSATSTVNVDATSGPFVVTAPNTVISIANNTPLTVTWNVANTTNTTVNAANVKISLSTDGGQTFPTVLSASTPNDGSEAVSLSGVSATTTARIKVEGVNNIFFDVSDTNFTVTASAVTNKTPFDFDGDGKADISVYRNGIWYLQRSTAGFAGVSFGISTDKTIVADYDGDNKADIAVYRATATDGLPDYYILKSSDNTLTGTAWGTTGDIPAAGDFDGDNKADYAIFRNGTWYILSSQTGIVRVEQFGLAGDRPVAADFDGDNKTDIAVYRNGTWYVNRSNLGVATVQFGLAGDIPTQADYDGDGKADYAVYRNGTWYLLRSNLGFTALQFGVSTDVPVAADFDGDGKADVSVFRPADGDWYLLRSQAGVFITHFGLNGDKPIPAQNNQ